MNGIWMVLFKISLAIFMAGSLLEMGLRLSLPDALRGLKSVRFVVHTLVWCFVICPALAYVITLIIPLGPTYAIGLILLGMAPCAPFVPMLVGKANGDLGFNGCVHAPGIGRYRSLHALYRTPFGQGSHNQRLGHCQAAADCRAAADDGRSCHPPQLG